MSGTIYFSLTSGACGFRLIRRSTRIDIILRTIHLMYACVLISARVRACEGFTILYYFVPYVYLSIILYLS